MSKAEEIERFIKFAEIDKRIEEVLDDFVEGLVEQGLEEEEARAAVNKDDFFNEIKEFIDEFFGEKELEIQNQLLGKPNIRKKMKAFFMVNMGIANSLRDYLETCWHRVVFEKTFELKEEKGNGKGNGEGKN